MLGLTGATPTLNRSHTPTQRSREYFTLRSIGDRGRPLYRLSMHIGCTGVSPSSQYIYKCGHTSFTLCGPPRYAPFTLCGSARCSTGQPVAIQHFFLLCGSARCASFSYSAGQPAAPRVSLRLFNISFCSTGQPAVHLLRTAGRPAADLLHATGQPAKIVFNLRVSPSYIVFILRVSPSYIVCVLRVSLSLCRR